MKLIFIGDNSLKLVDKLLFGCLLIITGCTKVPTKSEILQSDKLTPPSSSKKCTTSNHTLPILASASIPNSSVQVNIEKYLEKIKTLGFMTENQGIWIQTNRNLIANHRGTIPLPSASIAKIATSLVALDTFQPDYKFVTMIGKTGEIKNGILHGDLIIQGGNNPFFVWEDSIIIANQLEKLGIKSVRGNLLITDKFYMNFKLSPLSSGKLFKQGINAKNWTKEVENQYKTLPTNTPKPQLVIDGEVKVIPSIPNNFELLLKNNSVTLIEILKKMNRYSNNMMAAMINDAIGGKEVVHKKAAKLAGVPSNEIQLSQNKISPRAAVAMLIAIENYLASYDLNIGDVFTIIGKDDSILKNRSLPPFSILKSGIWEEISAIAGVLPSNNESIWVAIINIGSESELVRQEQDILLQNLFPSDERVVMNCTRE